MRRGAGLSKPRRGLLRWLARLPLWLFRLHLDRLTSERFLMLVHTGRRSGLRRATVLEVVGHDQGAYYVVSAWGEVADWYRNVTRTPRVTVGVAGGRLPPRREFKVVGEASDG